MFTLESMDQKTIRSTLAKLLERPVGSQKYDFGHVLVFGGSPGMIGASLLAGKAALRSGAGLVTLASEMAENLQGRIPEIMTHQLPLGDTDSMSHNMGKFITSRKVSTAVIGPGLGVASSPSIRQLVSTLDIPIVLDAGGLTAFTGNLRELASNGQRNPRLILTPHGGEFQKLSAQTIDSDPSGKLQRFAAEHNVTIILKGHRTLVAGPGATQLYQNHTSNPGMATAGSGDVLAGVIAGLCAQGLEPFAATCTGVYLHGLAGDLAADELSQPALIASDIVDYLPKAFLSLAKPA
jgi:NAD(P)H-hydrate epimerase